MVPTTLSPSAGHLLIWSGSAWVSSGTVPLTSGGTGATDASGARTALSLVPGTNIVAWDSDLDGIAALANSAIVARIAPGSFAARTITGDTEVVVSNGDGVSGNPTLSIGSAIARDSEMAALYQTLNSTLTRLAGIGAGTLGDLIGRDGVGWTNIPAGSVGQALFQKSGGGFAWSNVVASGVGDVTQAGNNAFTGTNSFAGPTSFDDLEINQITVISNLFVPLNAYGAGWNGSSNVVSEDAAYDQIELRAPKASPAITGTPTVNGTNIMSRIEDHLTEAEASALYQRTNSTLTRVAGIGVGTTGDLMYRDSTGWTNLAKGTQGQYLAQTATVPAWSNIVAGSSGDFVGPSSSTDNAIVRFDGTTGKLGQNSTVTLSDTGDLAGVSTAVITNLTVTDLINSVQTFSGWPRTNWTGRMRDFEPIICEFVTGQGATIGNVALPNWQGAGISSGSASSFADGSNHIGQVQLTSAAGANSGYYYLGAVAHYAQPGLSFESITRTVSTNAGTRISYGFHDSVSASSPTDALRVFQTNNFFIPQVYNNGSLTQGYEYPIEADTYYYHLVSVIDTNNCFFGVWNSDSGAEVFTTNIVVALPGSSARTFGSGVHGLHTNSVSVNLVVLEKFKLSWNKNVQR